MSSADILFIIALAGPAGFVLVSIATRGSGREIARSLLASRLASITAIGSALVAVALCVLTPGHRLSLPVVPGVDFLLDPVSVTIFALVAFIGAVVIQYSRNYLDGDASQGAFMRRLCAVLAAVQLLALSGNLIVLVFAWIATSLLLHRLLVFYPERRAAQIAARKKFLIARASDLSLIAAGVLLYRQFGTLDIVRIIDAARADTASSLTFAATFLLAFSAVLKSAQFPFHGWLPEVMETPTPVSALLHAGIINAGGFLLIRFADVLVLSETTMAIVAITGLATALFGSLCMLVQSSVKVSLAYSTIAQMGFMLLQCGLGAFSAALVHIVAHSLYKAHAFLSAGSTLDVTRLDTIAPPKPAAQGQVVWQVEPMVVLVSGAIFSILALAWEESRTPVLLAFVLGGAILQLIFSSGLMLQGRRLATLITQLVIVALVYFAIQGGAAWMLSQTLPLSTPVPAAVALMIIGGFCATWWLQLSARSSHPPAWLLQLYVPLSHGLYVNTAFDRLVGAFNIQSAPLKRN